MNVKGVKIDNTKYPFDYRYLAESPSSDKELIFGAFLDTGEASGSDGEYYISQSIDRGDDGLYLPLMLKTGDIIVVSYGGSEYEFEVTINSLQGSGDISESFTIGGDGYPFEIDIALEKYQGRSDTAYKGIESFECAFETENESETVLIYKRGGCIKHTVCSLSMESGEATSNDVSNLYAVLGSIYATGEEMEFELVIDGKEYRSVKNGGGLRESGDLTDDTYYIGTDLYNAGILPYVFEFSNTRAEIYSPDSDPDYDEPESVVINVPHKDLRHYVVFDDDAGEICTLAAFIGKMADCINGSSDVSVPTSDYLRIELL